MLSVSLSTPNGPSPGVDFGLQIWYTYNMFDRLIDLLVQFIDLFRFWEIVEAGEHGMRFTLGKAGKDFRAGFHWKLPFNIQKFIFFSTKTDTHELEPQTLISADGKNVTVQVYVKYRIRPEKAYAFIVELDEGSALFDIGRTAVAEVIEKHPADIPRVLFEQKVLDIMRNHLNQFGFKFLDCGLTQRTVSRTYRVIGGLNDGSMGS